QEKKILPTLSIKKANELKRHTLRWIAELSQKIWRQVSFSDISKVRLPERLTIKQDILRRRMEERFSWTRLEIFLMTCKCSCSERCKKEKSSRSGVAKK